MSGDIFGCHSGESATDIQWVEARDSAEHTTVHRTAPHTQNDQAPNVSGAEVDKPWSKETWEVFVERAGL